MEPVSEAKPYPFMGSTIEAALLHYQKHVMDTLKERSVGKGKERASVDSSLEEGKFEAQLLDLQFCLPHVKDMATAIAGSHKSPTEAQRKLTDFSPATSPTGQSLAENDMPYVNPLTGQIIYPQTPFTPGPSSAVEPPNPQVHQSEEERVAALRSEIESLHNPPVSAHEPVASKINTANPIVFDSEPPMPVLEGEGKHAGGQTSNESIRTLLPKLNLFESGSLFDSISLYAHRVLKPKESNKTPSTSTRGLISRAPDDEEIMAQLTNGILSFQEQAESPRQDKALQPNGSLAIDLDARSGQVAIDQGLRTETLAFRVPPSSELEDSKQRAKPQQANANRQSISQHDSSTPKPQEFRDNPVQSFCSSSTFNRFSEGHERELESERTNDSYYSDQSVTSQTHTELDSGIQVYPDQAERVTNGEPQVQAHSQQAQNQMIRFDEDEAKAIQLQADRTFALLIAGDIPQDFRVFDQVKKREEAKFLEEQRLARQLIEDRERQQIDQQLEAARELYNQWNAESARIEQQTRYAQELWNQERDAAANAEKSFDLARKLQAEWEEQNGPLQEQEVFARQLWEQENEAESQIVSSLALAQRLQAEWAAEDGQSCQGNTTNQEKFDQTVLQSTSSLPGAFPIRETIDPFSNVGMPPQGNHERTKPTERQGRQVEDWSQRQTRASDAFTPQTFWQGVPARDSSNRFPTFSSELQQQFQEAQKIQNDFNDQLRKENQEWETRKELYRRQEQEERQREMARLEAQKEARQIEAREREAQRVRAEAERVRLKAQQRALEEAKRKRESEAECVVCGDSFDKKRIAILPCKHAYCGPCIVQAFDHALQAKKPFSCCKSRVSVASVSAFLDHGFVATYQAWIAEVDSPNPLYCHERSCATFIPANNIAANIGTCPRCERRTCRLCRNFWHSGVCDKDPEGNELLQMAKKKNWQICPGCKTMVERREGCLHMTCRCGQEFCYNCGKCYSKCKGTCRRRF